MIAIHSRTYRWIAHRGKNHIVYEQDGEWFRTQCGEIFRTDARVRTCALKSLAVEGKCRSCVMKLRTEGAAT